MTHLQLTNIQTLHASARDSMILLHIAYPQEEEVKTPLFPKIHNQKHYCLTTSKSATKMD